MNVEKVYIVTSGEYSSYGIDAVFLDKKQAEMYCALHNKSDYDNYRVEKYEIGKVEGEIEYHKNVSVSFTNKGKIYYVNSVCSRVNIPTRLNQNHIVFSIHKDATKKEIEKMAYDLRAKFLYESEENNG